MESRVWQGVARHLSTVWLVHLFLVDMSGELDTNVVPKGELVLVFD